MLCGRHGAQPARLGADPLDRRRRGATAPGVHAVLTRGRRARAGRRSASSSADQPVLADDVVRYEGEPVALVAAETLEQARRAAAARRRRLRAAARSSPTWRTRCAPDAPAGARVRQRPPPRPHPPRRPGHGASADVWVEGYYETAMQDQAAARPRGRARRPGRGRRRRALRRRRSGSTSTGSRSRRCLGLPEEMVRITLAGVGGAFGSREDIHVQIHACLLALAHGPAGEDAPTAARSRSTATSTGTRRGSGSATARRATGGSSPPTCACCSTAAPTPPRRPRCSRTPPRSPPGPYEVPNVRIEGTVVYTNNPPCGAMRGFGAPQVCFAYESRDGRARREARDRPGRAPAAERAAHRARCCRPARC